MTKQTEAKLFASAAIFIILGTLLSPNSWAQQSAATAVPTLVRYSGVLTDASGQPMKGTIGITFTLYSDQQGDVPLWLETQNVVPDRNGHYSVQLGATKPGGLPTELFISGEARWLGVQPEGQARQPRVLLLSVPYALKAGDAETVGGLPASAFVLAAPASSALNPASEVNASSAANAASSAASSTPPPATNVTGAGTLNFIPLWTSTSNIANSVLFQSGSGATAKVGINTTSPAATLDVKGTANIQGLFSLPATGAATATSGRVSQGQDFIASSFNSGTAAAVNQTFQWRAEPTGNNTATPAGTLNLLFGAGASAPTETGLKLSSAGLFTFAAGQKFPGTSTITAVNTASGSGLSGGGTTGSLSLSLLKTCAANQTLQWTGTAWVCATLSGSGTITGVTAGTDLTGGGTSGKVTLNLDTTKVPQLNAVNTFTQTQVINAINPLGGILQVTSPYQAIAGTMTSNDSFTPAILGNASATGSGSTIGVEGVSSTTSGYGVWGSNTSGGIGVYAQNSSFSQGALYAENDGFGPAGYFKGNIQTTGKITNYNNSPTFANGVPSIVLYAPTFSSGGQLTLTDLLMPANDAVYRITGFQECTGTSSGGTYFSMNFFWTMPATGGGGGGSAGGSIFGGTCGPRDEGFSSGMVIAHVKGGTTLQYNYAGMDTSFQTTVVIEQLL